jgi:hypothetical protein
MKAALHLNAKPCTIQAQAVSCKWSVVRCTKGIEHRAWSMGLEGKLQAPRSLLRAVNQVIPPYGQERIVVYASETPMGDIPLAPLAAGLREYRGSNDDLAFRVRSIQPVARPGGGMTSGSTGFYEASWLVETGP